MLRLGRVDGRREERTRSPEIPAAVETAVF
jgi:hypothetical protein